MSRYADTLFYECIVFSQGFHMMLARAYISDALSFVFVLASPEDELWLFYFLLFQSAPFKRRFQPGSRGLIFNDGVANAICYALTEFTEIFCDKRARFRLAVAPMAAACYADSKTWLGLINRVLQAECYMELQKTVLPGNSGINSTVLLAI